MAFIGLAIAGVLVSLAFAIVVRDYGKVLDAIWDDATLALTDRSRGTGLLDTARDRIQTLYGVGLRLGIDNWLDFYWLCLLSTSCLTLHLESA